MSKQVFNKTMERTLLILLMIFAENSYTKAQTSFLGDDVRLFENTKAWKLALAVQKEDVVEIKLLCKNDTSLVHFQETTYGQSLLEWAVYIEHFEATKALAEEGANPNLQSYDGTSAFIHAADINTTSEYVKLLLQFGGDVNAVTFNSAPKNLQRLRTPLIAAAGSNLESTKILIENGADINYVSKHDQSALYSACLLLKIEIVKYLIENGADYKRPICTTLDGQPLYLTDELRTMPFELDSEKYKIKMQVVEFLKINGMDYWKTPIPSYLYKNYPQEYLDKY